LPLRCSGEWICLLFKAGLLIFLYLSFNVRNLGWYCWCMFSIFRECIIRSNFFWFFEKRCLLDSFLLFPFYCHAVTMGYPHPFFWTFLKLVQHPFTCICWEVWHCHLLHKQMMVLFWVHRRQTIGLRSVCSPVSFGCAYLLWLFWVLSSQRLPGHILYKAVWVWSCYLPSLCESDTAIILTTSCPFFNPNQTLCKIKKSLNWVKVFTNNMNWSLPSFCLII